MNNPNNSNRVVINLDDGLDDLDDDDITLPSLPVQSVPIIDETERTAVQAHNTANEELSHHQSEENIALATPIVMTEEHNVPKGASESFSSAKETGTTSKPNTATTIPAMPLQEQLGDTPSVSPVASSNVQTTTPQETAV
mgnify:CR=1 FL=1